MTFTTRRTAVVFVLMSVTTAGVLRLLSAQEAPPRGAPTGNPTPPSDLFAPGDEVTIGGRTYYVKDTGQTELVLSTPLKPTATIGDLITPVGASGTPGQAGTGREPIATIDGSGWHEVYPRSGVFVHTNNAYQGGASMWNTGGADSAFLQYDLGREFKVSGMYVWNFNESPPYNQRSLKDVKVQVSDDGKAWRDVGQFVFQKAAGAPEAPVQVIEFDKPASGRHFKLNALSRYGSDAFGLAEIRFANADKSYSPPAEFTSKYARPTYPDLEQGEALARAENIVFPAVAKAVDVSQPPYNARGDGVSDDTDAIQQALDDHPAQGAIIYLPNGRYLVSRQLRWGGSNNMRDASAAKNTILWGQSRDGTVIQLKDRCPGFLDPRAPRGVIWTGAAPAQRFGNEIHNLTVDTGLRNPGASGIQFIANNHGGIYDVRIQSGDGQGFAALDLGYTDEQGPMLVKHLETLGFDYGVSSAHGVASWTGEFITVRLPNKAGLVNAGQPASVRAMKFEGDVPAVKNSAGLLVLLDSTLAGSGPAKDAPAVHISGGVALVRNLTTSGFRLAVDDAVAKTQLDSPFVAEHRSIEPATLLTGADKTLSLPIKATPEVAWGDIRQWATPATSDSEGLQAAIDSGAATVLLPRGDYHIHKTIIVRGNVRRIIGARARLMIGGPLQHSDGAVFQIVDGTAPAVVIEGITTDFANGTFAFIDHATKRPLVLKQAAINSGAGQTPSALTYRNSVEGGQVFVEDVVSQRWEFRNQHVWARQFNAEPAGTRLIVDGGTFWCLGFKTEREGEIAVAKNGAKVEILGGLSQTTASGQTPMFVNDHSHMSVVFSEINHSNDPFARFVVEKRGDETKEWGDPNKHFRGWRAVCYEGRSVQP